MPTIDDVRAFWDRQPCNVKHGTADVGTIRWSNQVEARRYTVEPHILEFADFPRWHHRRVLDVGCGIATDGVCFARSGASYTGLDLSSVSLAIARERFTAVRLQARFLQGDAEHLAEALPNGEPLFDLVWSFGVLHHTPVPQEALIGIRQVLKSDGELRIMLYATNSWKAAMIEIGHDQPEAQRGCPIARTYTRDGATDLLERAGFRVESIEQRHIFPWRIPDYIEGRYVREPWWEAMPMETFRKLERALGWHLLIKARPITS